MEPAGDQLATSTDGRLFIPVHGGSILVRDTHAQRWIARLQHAQQLIAPKLTVSPDARWLAAVPFRSVTGGPKGPFVAELLLYDLSKLPAAGK